MKPTTKKKYQKVIEMIQQGYKGKDIAEQFSISPAYVTKIKRTLNLKTPVIKRISDPSKKFRHDNGKVVYKTKYRFSGGNEYGGAF